MKTKLNMILPVCFCVGLAALFVSCGDGAANSSFEDPSGSVKVVKVDAKELESPEYGEADSAVRAAATGANDFAFRLSAALVKNSGGDNFVCSPYSVWMPLAALVNATNSQNKAAVITALGAAGIGEADINRASSRMLYDLTKLRDKEYGEYYNPLRIANAVFVGKDVTLRKSFAQTFMDFYRGNAMTVDFSSRSAVDAVNRWASENTDGLITDLVKEFAPSTVAAIANAIYFSDRWESEFEPSETKEDVFHAPGGNSTAMYMLREGGGQTYYEDSRVQAIPLTFKSGGGLYIILPKSGGAAELLASMTDEYFSKIQSDSREAEGKLLLPRFSIDNDIKGLAEALIALGIPLFDGDSAPLRGGLIEEPLRVYLSSAMQKAVIKVDEKGTTAAAVTVLEAAGSAMPAPPVPFEMICNRPFVFVLYEYTYDGGSQVLFTGIVNQP